MAPVANDSKQRDKSADPGPPSKADHLEPMDSVIFDSELRGKLADLGEWPDTVLSFKLVTFVIIERILRLAMGWALFGTLMANPHNLVDHAYAEGAGRAVQTTVFVWLWVPSLLRLLFLTAASTEFQYKYSWESSVELLQRLVPSMGALLLGWVGLFFWLMGSQTQDVALRRTMWKSFCGTAVACGILESTIVLHAAKAMTEVWPRRWATAHGFGLSLFPMYMYYYDNVERSRIESGPSTFLLAMMLLSGAMLFVYEIWMNWANVMWSTDDRRSMLKSLSKMLQACMFAIMLFVVSVQYHMNHDTLRDQCDSHGLPVFVRYNDVEMAAEHLELCGVKCDSGVKGTNDCTSDQYGPCCNYISAIFSLGESYTMRRAYIVVLILYSIVFGLFDLVTELYYQCNDRHVYKAVPATPKHKE